MATRTVPFARSTCGTSAATRGSARTDTCAPGDSAASVPTVATGREPHGANRPDAGWALSATPQPAHTTTVTIPERTRMTLDAKGRLMPRAQRLSMGRTPQTTGRDQVCRQSRPSSKAKQPRRRDVLHRRPADGRFRTALPDRNSGRALVPAVDALGDSLVAGAVVRGGRPASDTRSRPGELPADSRSGTS